MTFRNTLIVFVLILFYIMASVPVAVFGTGPGDTAQPGAGSDTLFKLMIITMVVWCGICAYLIFLNKKITRVEKKIDEL